MREIIPAVLWIGNARDARDARSLMSLGIQAVIDVAAEEPPTQLPRELISCRFPLLDGQGNSGMLLSAAIELAIHFVNGRCRTLIACSGGMSRSPLIAAAVLTRVQKIDLEEATRRVAESGPCDISPALYREVLSIRSHCIPNAANDASHASHVDSDPTAD